MRRLLIFLFPVLVIFSCGKEDVSTGAPSLIGTWIHYSASDAWEIIYINSEGNGKVEWFTNNKLHKDTKEKTWYIKDNRLTLGKSTFSLAPYDVETYPTQSSNTVIEGFDTLMSGKKYIIMDGRYYKEK